ncbi:MAG: HIT domain-containing protein [Candidatus Pacebacteria bacterium]|nr:HIT domain-containing protein [Candidatus Paceibacterota bacterium]
MAKSACVFCEIINQKISAKIHYQDKHFLAFDDLHPQAPVHVLLIPKKHYPSLETLKLDNTQLPGELIATARKVAHKLKINSNYKLFMNIGSQVQLVPHLHLHLLGGWQKDKTTQELDQQTQNLINS